LKVGLFAGAVSVVIGVTLGLLGGYFGGWIDDMVVWVYSTIASMPTLLFILAFSLLVGKGFLFPPIAAVINGACGFFHADPGLVAVYVAIGVTGWVSLCRIIRAECASLRERPYVQAAKTLGYSPARIIIRHILPNLAHLVIVFFALHFAYAIMTEVIVSYLGLGVETQPSWGTMIADGQARLWQGVWWEVAAASAAMFFLVLALHLLGDALRDWLDPRVRA
jgi:peptide/nickel transport system permease protein